MGLLSKLFGGAARSVSSTLTKPLKVQDPTIGFLNLSGHAGAALMDLDQRALGPLFSQVRVSHELPPPQCEVLFVYCDMIADGASSRAVTSPRDLIKAAGACVAVFASENDGNAYIKRMGKRTDWGANIVMVLNRNGDRFAAFFRQLFTAMFEGQSMPTAWVRLAPQGNSPKHAENPSSIFCS